MARVAVQVLLPRNPNWVERNMDVVTNLMFHHIEAENASIFDINNWHLANGWNGGCGYNRYVKKNGQVFEGRPLNVIPAQCTNFNTVCIGVAVEGNYETTEEMPEVQKLALIACCQDIIEQYPQVKNFWKHSDKLNTLCPGKYFPYVEVVAAITGAKKVAENVVEMSPVENEILETQRAMNRLGFLGANMRPLVEDGINGNNTQTAVKQFQTVCNLVSDGIAGKYTWEAINQIFAKPLLSIETVFRIPTRFIQWKIGISPRDGIFGNGTKGSVIAYQQAHGLDADGIIGNQTWASLIG